jgi:hypothetical protein
MRSRASGTNDKAGSLLAVEHHPLELAPDDKETFAPPRAWRYPFMDEA